MGNIYSKTIICLFGLVFAVILAVQPVLAINGTLNIAYRGSGGSYLGDTVIFDGINTFSNTTLLKITGPGLPPEGLPVYDLNGQAGSGNTVEVSPDGSWKFSWYTGTIKGIEKLQTARYYITAFDLTYPEKTYITSILLKKPEFYVVVTPNLAANGDYIQLVGNAERGSSNVRFDITDTTGRIVHSYDSSVSATGYFNKGFHVDMPDGVYAIVMSSPSTQTTYRNYLTVVPPSSLASVTPKPTSITTLESPTATITVSPTPATPVSPASGTGSLSIGSTPAGASVYLDSVLVGTTPLELSQVTPGNHLIDVKAPGYLTFSVQVWVKEGETMAIGPVLLKNPSPMPLSLLTVIAGLLISLAVIAARMKRERT